MKLLWTDRAQRDLKEIRRYIARDDTTAARRWVDQLRAQARKVAEAPGMGRAVPELRRDDIREVFLRSYRIVYRVRDDLVEILTIFEGHRLLGATRIHVSSPRPNRVNEPMDTAAEYVHAG